jgi:hypothetical protein
MTSRRLTATLVASLAVVSLAACSDNDSGSGSSTPGGGTGSQALPPVMVGTDGLEGTTVQVPLTNTIVINAENPTTWAGSVSDISIASFVPGRSDGSATFNPAITPLKAGTTTVTITDGTATITFTVQVNG